MTATNFAQLELKEKQNFNFFKNLFLTMEIKKDGEF